MILNSVIPLQILGAGPAGMGMVLALCNRIAEANGDAAWLNGLLDSLQIFEASANPGGRMGHYRVNANTSSHDVVQGIKDGTPFVKVRDDYLAHPETRSELIPLTRIQTLMVEPLVEAMREFLGERLHCGIDIARIEVNDTGFASYDREQRLWAVSENLLFCCGAIETPLPEVIALRDRWEGSMQFLSRDTLEGLPDTSGPVVIIGASHSAFSCAWRLLHDPLFAEFSRDREILILQRREGIKLRCTPDFAAAHQIDYDPVTDVCPRTGLVFFHGGLRKDAKFLYLDIRDGRENRVRLVQLDQLGEQQAVLDQAGLILQATGFSANLPRIEQSSVELRVGNPTRNGELRGEQSFSGGVHGFQSYPLTVAPRIIDRLKAEMPMGARS